MRSTFVRRGGTGRRLELVRRHRGGTQIDSLTPPGRASGAGFYRYCPVESWQPAVNLYESKTSYFVCVDLAGMDRESIDVVLNDNVLVISGARDHPRPPESAGHLSIHLMEIDQGPFCRSVEIPTEVDLSAIRATYASGGFLWIELPKTTD
ncbi:MAG: Hsp20/alpha crystallin family protein [Phycisphaerae bacterium]|nr:Hsp20/alpha crystallin family protein [Phycisphaerae bacterium]